MAAKAKLARLQPAEPGGNMMALAAFRVGHALILAARNKDVRRKRSWSLRISSMAAFISRITSREVATLFVPGRLSSRSR
jgi:hypothetical protein